MAPKNDLITVHLAGSLSAFADGLPVVHVKAQNLRSLLDALATKYPALAPRIERGVTVSIDGVMYNDAWFTPITSSQEIHIIDRLIGG